MTSLSGVRKVQLRELAMKLASSSIVGASGIFLIYEEPQVRSFPVVTNLCAPTIVILVKTNAPVLTGVAAICAVATVLRACRRAQIVESIILPISVDMVNLVWRQLACHKEKSEPPGPVYFSLELNHTIASVVNMTCDIANFDLGADTGTLNPPKESGVSVVGQVIADDGEAHNHDNDNTLYGRQAFGALI